MKILVIGGSGLLGQQVVHFLKENDLDVYSTYHSKPIDNKKKLLLDITKKVETEDLIKEIKPEAIVLTAAFTNVDKCEKLKDIVFSVNVNGTSNVASAAEAVSAKMVYVSTDYVFNGEKGQYEETDNTEPVNYYGLSKLKGEEQVQNICSDYIIARTSVLFGLHKPNFVTWIISQLKQNKSISIVTDQIISPTHTLDLSEQILALLKRDANGVFHTAGRENLSRFDFAVQTSKMFGFDIDLINPVLMDTMNWIAKRPKNSSLNISKISKIKKPYRLEKALGLLKKMAIWEER